MVKGDGYAGYILEVELEYPKALYDLHNDYPLAPEKLMVSSNMLSRYCLSIAENWGIKAGEVSKLIPNLMSKEKYEIRFRNL